MKTSNQISCGQREYLANSGVLTAYAYFAKVAGVIKMKINEDSARGCFHN
jgi:hypothetical protein